VSPAGAGGALPWIRSAFAALPDFAIAAAAIITWRDPSRLGESWVPWFLTLMLLEFIVVHSSAFLGTVAFSDQTRTKRLTQALGLTAFYTLFAAAFAWSAGSWWPVWAFWGLTANRLLGIIFGAAPTGAERDYAAVSWASGVACYLFGAFATILLPLPRLGVRSSMLGKMGEDSGGLWVEEPHRVVAFAAIYFTLVGLTTLFAHRWLPKGLLAGAHRPRTP
jgi:hypothetical protein